MEKMWKKVGFSGRTSKSSTTIQSTDTASSAGFGGEHQVQVAALASTATGRRLATSGEVQIPDGIPPPLPPPLPSGIPNSLSQHILHQSTASSERRRKRRRKSRQRPRGTEAGRLFRSFRNDPSGAAQQPSNSGETLKQRAVAKLRMFNFHLNWDLHMTPCKPCVPRSGNIFFRNRRGEDNELYRSNSFKFERFERKENVETTGSLRRKISVCDDYSLPIDFVKKRPSSFDPCLAETLPDNWAIVAPSPLSEHVSFLDPPTVTKHPTLPIQQKLQQLYSQSTKKKTNVKLIEGYSDPKDSKKHSRHNRKTRKDRQRIKNYCSDSSAPKSSADEDEPFNTNKVPELNSPDSIADDLIKPLQSFKSPKKLTGLPDINKRNPSPYYYSDLLKSKESEKETKAKSRQSTASEPAQSLSTSNTTDLPPPAYRKSSSLDVPDIERNICGALEDFPQQQGKQKNSSKKRYSITEEGVRIIRCQSPSTSTSDDSDCSECQQRREWHAKALALVRKTCNITAIHHHHPTGLLGGGEFSEDQILNQQSMPPHRILGPAVCACAAPALGDDIDEYFRPRSIFYVHAQGADECEDCCIPNNLNNTVTSDKSNNSSNKSRKQQQNEDEMSSGGGRTRQIYETAFDCKIAKSDDDLDEVDRVTNQSVLLEIENGNNNVKKPPKGRSKGSKSSKARLESKRLKNTKNQALQDNNGSVSTLSNDLENIHIDNNVDQMNNTQNTTSQLPIRGYTPSPPSTAPLPVKFPSKHDRFFMNSIVNQSAPNLPSNPAHPRLKDLRLPIKSLRQKIAISNDSSLMDSGTAAASIDSTTVEESRTRERPRSIVLESGRVIELRKSHHHHHQRGRGNNYSSTESMATSSSGGSMESLRSSTSEGNRSTTSSESRHSTSLSSHSSESAHSVSFPLRAPILLHSKLHILSPISDKSSLEPASDASELNKKISPGGIGEDGKFKITAQVAGVTETIPEEPKGATENGFSSVPKQIKKRPPTNKNLLHLTDEILGSDSGISLHSREDGKSAFHRFGLTKLNFPNTNSSITQDKSDLINSGSLGLPQDLRDLPFDMPKLRRRKINTQQDACTSGSATSVDLGDLPFDMPKLRRRLRLNQSQMNNLMLHSTESSSQASSSHSVDQNNKPHDLGVFRQNLTLNFNELKSIHNTNKFGSLDLRQTSASSKGLNLNISTTGIGYQSAVDLIDVAIPLERQGWYHGAITRIEAETTLRPLNEGSFLVRNCESTKQDYSLSLKGAKGFMHMRIQRNDLNQYILGQFSRPFDSVPEMIRHFCINRLPVRGAEHMCLLDPVIAQLL